MPALVLVIVAWGAVIGGDHFVTEPDVSRFGRCEDVQEAMARDTFVIKHVSRQRLPYIRLALALDVVAVGVLIWTMIRRQCGRFGVAILLLCLRSASLHAPLWLLVSELAT